MRAAAAVFAAVAVLAGGAASAPPPVASTPPATLRAKDPWTMTVRPALPRAARVEIRLGALRAQFALRTARRSSRAKVVFPRPGVWTYGVRLGAAFKRLGRARVRPRPLALGEASDAIEIGGAIVISDRQTGVVHRLEPNSGHHVVLARMPEARELERLDDRTFLVSSENRILRVDSITGSVSPFATAGGYVLGLARAADGALIASEDGDRIVRLDGGVRRTLATGRNGVHGLFFSNGVLIACETFAGTVLELDPAGGPARVVASRLGNPSSAVRTPSGATYITEFVAGRVAVLGPGGTVRSLALLPRAASLSLTSDGSLLATTLDGRVLRLDPATGRARSVLP